MQDVFSYELDQSGFLKKGPAKVHVLHHREFKTDWNSFTSPLLKLIPVIIDQSQAEKEGVFPGQHR